MVLVSLAFKDRIHSSELLLFVLKTRVRILTIAQVLKSDVLATRPLLSPIDALRVRIPNTQILLLQCRPVVHGSDQATTHKASYSSTSSNPDSSSNRPETSISIQQITSTLSVYTLSERSTHWIPHRRSIQNS